MSNQRRLRGVDLLTRLANLLGKTPQPVIKLDRLAQARPQPLWKPVLFFHLLPKPTSQLLGGLWQPVFLNAGIGPLPSCGGIWTGGGEHGGCTCA